MYRMRCLRGVVSETESVATFEITCKVNHILQVATLNLISFLPQFLDEAEGERSRATRIFIPACFGLLCIGISTTAAEAACASAV